ncbi:MAG: DUF6134 family protein [Parvibaculum sp.]|nr:DUF6134 family protein [Parvibaculum sp.]
MPRFPRVFRCFAVGLAVFLTLGSAHAQDVKGIAADFASVRALYGEHISFDVWRNGTLVGAQTVNFSERDGALFVDIDFQLKIEALYITFYKMRYQSRSLWRNGKLVMLSAKTDRNGEVTEVDAQAASTSLKGDGPKGLFAAPLDTYPTDHWNAGVISTTELINTINGSVNKVRLVPQGVEDVQTERGVVKATHYKYEGEIQNEVWYDADGRWVHMKFNGDDGSLIEFRCRKCFAGNGEKAS